MRKFLSGFALFATLVLVAAACGDTADTGLPDTSTPLPTEDAVSGDVDVIDSAYEPKEFTATAGEPVVFFQTGSIPHTVTASDGSWDSHPDCPADTAKCMQKGDTYEYTFDEPGEYPYYCKLHGTKDGAGMAGTVIVEA